MRIGICGIGGRMGAAVYTVLGETGDTCSLAIDREDSGLVGRPVDAPAGREDRVAVTTIADSSLAATDVLIDFSSPGATLILAKKAAAAGIPLVIGTTGFSDDEKQKILAYGSTIPVILSPNMALGVNLLFKLTELAARALDRSYDVEVYEAHHRFKKDAPSGTARRLIESVRAMDGMDSAALVNGREGLTGERSDREIGIQVVRAGDIIGDHTVMFAALGERIELTHRASSRETFARGAVRAARYLAGKKPGCYSMFDVLGIS